MEKEELQQIRDQHTQPCISSSLFSLHNTCLLLFQLVLLLANQTHFLRAQQTVNIINDIEHKLFCSRNTVSSAESNSSSEQSSYNRALFILKNYRVLKWGQEDLQKMDPLIAIKYLETLILQCEIQELPEPETAIIFCKNPTIAVCCSLTLFPEPCAVCS